MATAAGTSPERSIEIEKKFDVDEGTPMPDWASVPGVADVSAGEERHLDATYFDTADVDLAAAGVAVRRRTGGPDAGWHIKGPLVDGGRTELGWPLGDGQAVPDQVRAELARWTDAPLEPLARIVNDRTAYALRDAAGGVVAEFVDDRVRATDLRADVERAWCEWEIELGPAAPADHDAFFAEITRIALASGARNASSASKLARALGR
ncbi:CYTH domain-containing protein [Microbacterium sp. JB110]|uniref:CYTH domain-containing protein n=1 Tax=Microbacterium sp. JB110 TaxID=2024477 RepID=UPI00097EC364|nr:CYTH domain-containing protein [Microbacterium sp. JB110]RCS62718.1 CYTH domain-containing protein [Microbacterium sp. JB110]SJM63228.1 Adenylate cyclase [Frigoribacterium sp. JB110]